MSIDDLKALKLHLITFLELLCKVDKLKRLKLSKLRDNPLMNLLFVIIFTY